VAEAGYLHEVFRSIQGEGWYVGALQIFVRMSGCSLRCRYCDTTEARDRVPECVLHGDRAVRRVPNPVEGAELTAYVLSLAQSSPGIHSVSFTGGEPLEQREFLRACAERLAGLGLPLYLETNGLAQDSARAVAPLFDIVSLDIKLPSLCGGDDYFAVYRRVLPLFGTAELFCKVVLADGYAPGEFTEAVRIVAEHDARVPFIIQPARPTPACGGVTGEALLACHAEAARFLDTVRVIPQCHPLLGLP
jgi:7-carboxy-7-deazaguanine synthase